METATSARVDPETGRIIQVLPSGHTFCKSARNGDSCRHDENLSSLEPTIEHVTKESRSCQLYTSYRRNEGGEVRSITKRKICLTTNETWRKHERLPDQSHIAEGCEFGGTDSFGTVLSKWKNPVLGVPGDAALHLRLEHSLEKHMKKFLKINNLFSFEKRILKEVRVLGQVDKKFIACVTSLKQRSTQLLTGPEQDQSGLTKCSRVIILFDQHAVHERIRLERLQQHLLCGLDQPFDEKRKTNDPLKAVPFSILNPVLKIQRRMKSKDAKRLREHLADFKLIGFSLTVENDSPEIVTITVSSLPRLFTKSRSGRVLEKSSNLTEETVYSVILEHLDFLGGNFNFSPRIPPAIAKVLNCLACHGAIRFGDALSIKDMTCLLSQLAHCDLPFQCAHGRPSVIPLCNLSLLAESLKTGNSLPKISRLLNL